MEGLYSTEELLLNISEQIQNADVGGWLVSVGWKIDIANIFDDGNCAEVTLSHPLFDAVVDISANNQSNTEYLIRSVFDTKQAEQLIAESKLMWTVVEPIEKKGAA